MDLVVRKNHRGHQEIAVQTQHLKLSDLNLKMTANGLSNKYLPKDNIPEYPRPEFWVSQLRHDTDEGGLLGIAVEDKGSFRAREREQGPEDPEQPGDLDLLWWSLSVGPEEIVSAEQRLLQASYPDRTEEQAREQQPFLERFATSPAFLDSSRLGPFRFIYSLQELLKEYRKQFCGGQEPNLRIYETVLYKQEVMYSVLVHSPWYNNLFHKYPLLQDNEDGVCAYRDGQIIWRPEAMCGTHSFQLVRKPYQNQDVAHQIPVHEFYVWDNVAVVFHMADSMELHVSNLSDHLSICDPGYPLISKKRFISKEEARIIVKECWPDPKEQ